MWEAEKQGRVPMGHTTWLGMCGNGSLTGMTRLITKSVKKRTLKGQKRVRTKCSAEAPGSMLLGGCDHRTATSGIRRSGSSTWDFGVPGTPPNPLVFVLLPFSLSSHFPLMYLNGVGIAIVHRTDGKDPRTDEPAMELRKGDCVGVRPPLAAGGFVERQGYRMDHNGWTDTCLRKTKEPDSSRGWALVFLLDPCEGESEGKGWFILAKGVACGYVKAR